MAIGELDEYTLRARVFPAFIALIPLGITLGQFASAKSVIVSGVTGLGGAALFSFLLAQWSRDSGKEIEGELIRRWGGKPTTIYLRHRTPRENHVTHMRRHSRLQTLVFPLIVPTVADEQQDPEAADAHFDAATKVLIQRTRDKTRFGVLFQELIDYGFRRNLLGLRTTAMLICALASTLSADLIIVGRNVTFNWIALSADILAILLWIGIRHVWVQASGRRYAERLFDCLDTMSELDN